MMNDDMLFACAAALTACFEGRATGLCVVVTVISANKPTVTDYKLYLLIVRKNSAVETKTDMPRLFVFIRRGPAILPPSASAKRFAVFPFLLSLEFSLSLPSIVYVHPIVLCYAKSAKKWQLRIRLGSADLGYRSRIHEPSEVKSAGAE